MHNGGSKGFRDCIGTHKAYMGTAGKERKKREEKGEMGEEGKGNRHTTHHSRRSMSVELKRDSLRRACHRCIIASV